MEALNLCKSEPACCPRLVVVVVQTPEANESKMDLVARPDIHPQKPRGLWQCISVVRALITRFMKLGREHWQDVQGWRRGARSLCPELRDPKAKVWVGAPP